MHMENGPRKQQASIIDGRRLLTGTRHPGIPAPQGLWVKLCGPARPSSPSVRSPLLLPSELWAWFWVLNAILKPDPALGSCCICWEVTASSDFSPHRQSCSSGLSSFVCRPQRFSFGVSPGGAVGGSVLPGVGFLQARLSPWLVGCRYCVHPPSVSSPDSWYFC